MPVVTNLYEEFLPPMHAQKMAAAAPDLPVIIFNPPIYV
jgi:hypothetical protein